MSHKDPFLSALAAGCSCSWSGTEKETDTPVVVTVDPSCIVHNSQTMDGVIDYERIEKIVRRVVSEELDK